MSFDSFGGESSYDVADFINNPWDNQLYEDIHVVFRFEKQNGQLILTGISSEDGSHKQGQFLTLNDPDNWGWKKFRTSEYFQRAIIFLCDEEGIKECFRENGIENIQKMVILDGPNVETGYIITAITETQAYFMTVPISNEKYGDYIFQKVYTQDEFLKIFNPRSAKVFINEQEITFLTTPLFGYTFLEIDLFEFLDALDIQYTYDEENNIISSNEVILQIKEYSDGSYCVDIFKNGSEHVDGKGGARYENGKYIGNLLFYDELCRVLGYDMELHYDDYSVRIVKS